MSFLAAKFLTVSGCSRAKAKWVRMMMGIKLEKIAVRYGQEGINCPLRENPSTRNGKSLIGRSGKSDNLEKEVLK